MSAFPNERRYQYTAKAGSALTLAAADAEIWGGWRVVVGRGARAGECCARARG
jgi:hypothetical protein